MMALNFRNVRRDAPCLALSRGGFPFLHLRTVIVDSAQFGVHGAPGMSAIVVLVQNVIVCTVMLTLFGRIPAGISSLPIRLHHASKADIDQCFGKSAITHGFP